MSRLLVFDFDGVICDSADECLVSSWIAYHRCDRSGPCPDRLPVTLRAEFLELRPFARSGEDYVLLQDLLHRGVPVNSQNEYDRRREEAGAETMRRFRELIYRTRDDMLSADREYWLGLNRIYPVFRHWLPALSIRPEFTILSTKRADLILEILAWHGFPFPAEHVIDSGGRGKLEIISSLLEETGADQALFLDDQVDHFQGAVPAGVECRLASWGYIQPVWLTEPGPARPIDVPGLERLLAAALADAVRPD